MDNPTHLIIHNPVDNFVHRVVDSVDRGVRRSQWIDQALAPLRDRLTTEQYDRLASALSVVLGWETMVVLRDVRGQSAEREAEIIRWMAQALVTAMLGEQDRAE